VALPAFSGYNLDACADHPGAEKMIKDLAHLFRWQDALDILILTFVFYRFYLRVRRKRTLKMIAGLLILPVFYLFAQGFDLSLSVWGLQNLWAVILLVLVVLFQQEIRDVLGSLSLPSFLFGKAEEIPVKVADMLSEAAFLMAERGIGGLLVIQRGDDIDDLIHERTQVDGEISENLLVTLFTPLAPLHDGAVVIRGDRVRYASAFLPVSASTSLPKEWGTRHRAAAGITEVTDAECIVISEERKEVLLAYRGRIERKADREELRASLSHLPIEPREKAPAVSGLSRFLHDLPVRGFFLFLAVLLWVSVIGLRQGEIGVTLPVEYYSIPPNLEISGSSPTEAHVRLRGSQRLLASAGPDHLRIQIDLSSARPGINPVVLSDANITVPSGMTVTRFFPKELKVYLSPLPSGLRRP
jgi:diadenylate cyclase